MRHATLNAVLMSGFVLCWSSGFIGSELASRAPLNALDLFAWRFVIAAALAALWWRLLDRRPVALSAWLREMAVGALTMGGYLLCVVLAIGEGVSASVTALITAQQPLLAAAIATLWLREQLPAAAWLGLGVAGSGVVLCIAGDWQGAGGAGGWAYALPLLAVISVTLGSVLAARRPSGLGLAASLTAQLSAAALIFGVAATGAGGLALPGSALLTWQTLGWLVLLSSFGGYGFFTVCLRRLGVNAVSSAIYLTPPVTLAWSAGMFGEHVAPLQLGGMALALAGVALALLAQRRGRHTRGAAHYPRRPGGGECA
ncbi:DMT family transporter [Salinicola sp. DM10]|uniref:DMT family transporter n=2 Tax=Salinicola TaxID=404432 RepID=UPI001A8C9127|nr:DMT family transporter [Salinicola sp. DM10]MCE3027751.1 DMT family transporter [Salinicola sp. DM10]